MKVFIKIGLVILGVAGVLYWLGGKCLLPARRLRDHYKHAVDEEQNV